MVTPGSKQAKGFAIQISLLLANIPSLELVFGASKPKAVSKKRPAADVGAAVTKKKRTIKKKSVSSLSTLEMVAVAQEAVPIQQVADPSAVEETRCPSTDDVDSIIQQVIDETREVDAPADKEQPAATEEKHWFDLPYEDLIAKWAAERPVVTASDTDEEVVEAATLGVVPAGEDQQVQEFLAQIGNDDLLDADEQKSLEDILLEIPV
ncbi:nucleolin-like [Dorcoceras hygrometricum]|uniref:Nucleolin-like n=1 Tax=Dorcoceras hygrometricum TaxID=472368 RepID=A0A2Z6ZU26_9LAMI|nr:nucleolin-like [Dorcoceras hygrometricum]